MIGDILKKIFGDKNAKDKKEYWPFVEAVEKVYPSIKNLSDNELRLKKKEIEIKQEKR